MTLWPWLAGAAVLWLGWALVEPALLRVKRYRLNLPGWPADYGPLRVAFLSDFHMGMPHMNMRRLRTVV